MCFALEYFIINIKPPGPSPTPTHPLWILLCYILKLKNNISIHFSVSRYNLTHEMTFLNVILPRRQTLELYTMDLRAHLCQIFKVHKSLITLGKEPSGPDLLGCRGEHSTPKWSPWSGMLARTTIYNNNHFCCCFYFGYSNELSFLSLPFPKLSFVFAASSKQHFLFDFHMKGHRKRSTKFPSIS